MVHFRIARFLSHRLALLGDLRGSRPTRHSAIRIKTRGSRLIVEFIALKLRCLESRLHHQLQIPLVHDRQAKMLGTHVAQDPLRQATQFAREPRSHLDPALSAREDPTSADRTSFRGSQEYLQTREQRTNQQSKSKEAQKNHQVITVAIRRHHRVSAPRRDAARDSNYQTYSHSNPPRIYHKDGGQDFLQEPDSTDTKTGSNLEGIQPFYSTDRASRGLVCSICEAYFLFRPAVKQ